MRPHLLPSRPRRLQHPRLGYAVIAASLLARRGRDCAVHLIALSIPAHKSPRSFGPLTAHTAGRGSVMRLKHGGPGFFRLANDEEAVIKNLVACMAMKAPSPGMEAAFDYVGRVIARRRYGYVSEWRQLASWTEKDWDRWLAATDHVSN
jgi:hypothetical protein